ncbi:ATP-binding protein [Silanimonas sp.]|uniref:ATP-binding protein n=1 Tax=Silanimonas sp. TaxID=1929290 RepID=UPI0022BB4946|nr:ATP-binding protein [Silanimonas sp.]MCZ8165506.1 putative DNA binding domain-containing protein [Silanimonas sp.]
MSPTQQLSLFDEFSLYEGVDVEYKSAAGGLPASLWETYSAFANSGGGTIWLGVAEKNGVPVVQGVPEPQKIRAEIFNLANNRQKISANLLSEESVRVIEDPSERRHLVCIVVPRASRRERPVHVGPNPFSGTYRRNHDGDYRCTDDEVRRMFADQSDEPADGRILEGFGFNDLHAESLRQFRARFSVSFPNHAWLVEDDVGLLLRLGGFRRDRQSGKEGLTVAGLLMFGQELAIRDPGARPRFHLDYRERLADSPDVRWSDRITLDGTWEGNLFQFYQRVMVSLSAGPGLRRPFQRDEEGYRRSATPVHEALQEALVNALIHADYSGQGGVVIDRYLDRFEFSNPGTLLLSRAQLLQGGVSECRNPALQKMFQMLGAGDKAGSGIDKIRKSWQEQRWQSPSIAETTSPDRVQLTLPMVSTLPEEAVTELDRRFGQGVLARTGDEIQALVTALEEGVVTNQRLQDMLVMHSVDITRMLQGLVRDGLLRPEGRTRGTRYLLGGSPPDLAPSPPDLAPSPPDLASSPPDLAPPETGDDGDRALLDLATRVREMGKAPAGLVRATILRLCSARFLSVRELSELLGRTPETLRDGYVAKLADEGLLELRYPDNRSHPEQAYRTRVNLSEGSA